MREMNSLRQRKPQIIQMRGVIQVVGLVTQEDIRIFQIPGTLVELWAWGSFPRVVTI